MHGHIQWHRFKIGVPSNLPMALFTAPTQPPQVMATFRTTVCTRTKFPNWNKQPHLNTPLQSNIQFTFSLVESPISLKEVCLVFAIAAQHAVFVYRFWRNNCKWVFIQQSNQLISFNPEKYWIHWINNWCPIYSWKQNAVLLKTAAPLSG
jgi:hypothetical protein